MLRHARAIGCRVEPVLRANSSRLVVHSRLHLQVAGGFEL